MWSNFIHEDITIIPIELSGKGIRSDEPLYRTFVDMVDDVCRIIKSQIIDDTSVAFFGHSIGALILYELCRRHEIDRLESKITILSGITLPSHYNNRNIHKQSDEEFLKFIISLGGVSEDLVMNRELWEIFLPLIRNDIRLTETFGFEKLGRTLETKVAIFHGKDDMSTQCEMNDWQQYLGVDIHYRGFAGGHFFIHSASREVIKEIESLILL